MSLEALNVATRRPNTPVFATHNSVQRLQTDPDLKPFDPILHSLPDIHLDWTPI